MIHLGIITDRVPLIPPFMPGFHICEDKIQQDFEA